MSRSSQEPAYPITVPEVPEEEWDEDWDYEYPRLPIVFWMKVRYVFVGKAKPLAFDFDND